MSLRCCCVCSICNGHLLHHTSWQFLICFCCYCERYHSKQIAAVVVVVAAVVVAVAAAVVAAAVVQQHRPACSCASH